MGRKCGGRAQNERERTSRISRRCVRAPLGKKRDAAGVNIDARALLHHTTQPSHPAICGTTYSLCDVLTAFLNYSLSTSRSAPRSRVPAGRPKIKGGLQGIEGGGAPPAAAAATPRAALRGASVRPPPAGAGEGENGGGGGEAGERGCGPGAQIKKDTQPQPPTGKKQKDRPAPKGALI